MAGRPSRPPAHPAMSNGRSAGAPLEEEVETMNDDSTRESRRPSRGGSTHMKDALAYPKSRGRGRIRLLLNAACAGVLVVAAAILPGTANADTTVTTNQTGTNNGFF